MHSPSRNPQSESPQDSSLPQISPRSNLAKSIEIYNNSVIKVQTIRQSMPQGVKDIFGHSTPKALRAKAIHIDMEIIKQNVYRDAAKDYSTLPVPP